MLHGQRGFSLLIYAAAGLAVIGALAFLHHKVTAPYKQQIAQMKDAIEANKIKAAALLKQREKENADLAEKWRIYARESDESYQNKIDHLRDYRNAAGGVRLNTGCGASSSPAGQAATGSAEAPAIASGGQGTSDAAREFAFDESAVATVLEWYAYGLSCHAFVNSK